MLSWDHPKPDCDRGGDTVTGTVTRRSFLTAVGVTGGVVVSGCLSSVDSPGSAADARAEYLVESSLTSDAGLEPLDFEVTQRGETVTDDAPTEFVFELSTDGATATIESGTPAPFGIVGLDAEAGSARPVYPWTERYVASDHVDTDGEDVVGAEDVGLTTRLSNGRTITRAYELSPDTPRLDAGEYTLSESYDVSLKDASDETAVATVEGTVRIE